MHQRFVKTHDWAAADREYRALMHDPAVLRTVQDHPISLFFIAAGRPDDSLPLFGAADVYKRRGDYPRARDRLTATPTRGRRSSGRSCASC